jgi:hypothetical protein
VYNFVCSVNVLYIHFSFSENRLIDGDLRRDALALQKSGDWDDNGPQLAEAMGTENGGASTANSQVLKGSNLKLSHTLVF